MYIYIYIFRFQDICVYIYKHVFCFKKYIFIYICIYIYIFFFEYEYCSMYIVAKWPTEAVYTWRGPSGFWGWQGASRLEAEAMGSRKFGVYPLVIKHGNGKPPINGDFI